MDENRKKKTRSIAKKGSSLYSFEERRLNARQIVVKLIIPNSCDAGVHQQQVTKDA
jgi:hypothetical protein